MKKYLMTGVAAIAFVAAFTGCSKSNDLYDEGAVKEREQQQEQQKVENNIELAKAQYAAAFEKAFGKVGSNVDWGFSSKASTRGTRANAGQNYPSTSTGINANANEWADPNKDFGGWVVPDALTDGQKLRVKAYFQANPNLTYKDPEWRHFFVQQVYKGASSPGVNSTEKVTAANNSVYDSGNMNLLTVGQNNQHINNFNAGDCSSRDDVLDNGQAVGGSSHTDKIMLMVNIDDTSCFGYHETGGSKHHNDKAALVAASVIDEWAARNGNIGEAVVDKWNRSFVGLDLELRNANDVKSNTKVTYNNGPEGVSYIVLNNEFVTVNGSDPMEYNNEDVYFIDTNTNQYSAETSTMNDSQLMQEVRINGDYKGKALNMDNINAKLAEGWLPVQNKNLREWVKVTGGDGYFTDWIVTLSKAKRIDEKALYRVIAEDLNASESTDFDFNDVVFDVVKAEGGKTTLKLIAAGGIYKLTVAGVEVHEKFEEKANEKGEYPMINTGDGPNHDPVEFTIDGTYTTPEQIKNIEIRVYKPGFEKEGVALYANTGEAACKILVDDTFGIIAERHGVADEHTNFHKYVQGTWDPQTNGFWWKKSE